MAKLTPKQANQYARLVRKIAEYRGRGGIVAEHFVPEFEAELAFLDAIKARTTKQHVYREPHDAHVKLWGAQIVTRKNLMSGTEYQERRDTPAFMSPSCETYWSM